MADTIVKFDNEQNFEGKKYNEIDLAGLDDLTTMDLTEAQRLMQKNNEIAAIPEMNLTYCLALAGAATKLPIEFFKQLKAKDAIKVRTQVTAAFLG